ncbi:hypothetical protein EAG_02282 [Camponotus floridanus]|uniref:Uncharacterized protein n=1 Tax=Camponotus floridanus TaxID=104421 RepID=E2AMX3_CAMFO|nr:hypothetical protein EAG_02282 [Camponotus floridanus]
MLDALLDTLSQPSLHLKARVCVAVPGITFDPISVTYSADLGDRRGEGKDSKIETSVGTREYGKQWVILPAERGGAYPRKKLCAPPGDAPLPVIFRERIFGKSIGSLQTKPQEESINVPPTLCLRRESVPSVRCSKHKIPPFYRAPSVVGANATVGFRASAKVKRGQGHENGVKERMKSDRRGADSSESSTCFKLPVRRPGCIRANHPPNVPMRSPDKSAAADRKLDCRYFNALSRVKPTRQVRFELNVCENKHDNLRRCKFVGFCIVDQRVTDVFCAPLSPSHFPRVNSTRKRQGPPLSVTAVLEGTAELPCDIRPPHRNDSAILVVWYKSDVIPIYR